jgi:hypothetical protein
MRRIIAINQKVSKNVIDTFNADIDKIPKSSLPFNLKIDVPEFDSPLRPITLSDDEYEAKKKALGL